MKKVKVGVFGVGRGASLSEFFTVSENAEIVAVCDKWEDGLRRFEKQMNNPNIACFTSFDAFIEHDMDAVVLANYANEHARFAMTCLKKGKHVFSEVLPVQTMQEAVELVEAVESSDRIYAYGENYCFMPAPREMRKLYRQGMLGEFEYGEGEYMHNCESIWPQITQGNPDHWRNNMYANFYCTHSIGPLIHITGQRPVKVTGFELPFDARMARCGAKAGACGIEMITLENGAILKSIHGNAARNSVWYSIYGAKAVWKARGRTHRTATSPGFTATATNMRGRITARSSPTSPPMTWLKKPRRSGTEVRISIPCITSSKKSGAIRTRM